MSFLDPVDQETPASSQELPVLSSPTVLSPQSRGQNGRKERRNPSVTPRKFRRFFTPRSHGSHMTSARQALYDITAPSNNRNVTQSSPIRPPRKTSGQENSSTFPRDLKRRKLHHFPGHNPQTPESSPEYIYNAKHQDLRFRVPQDLTSNHDSDDETTAAEDNQMPLPPELAPIQEDTREDKHLDAVTTEVYSQKESEKLECHPIIRMEDRGLAAQLLNVHLGVPARSARQRFEYPVNDWQDETSSFYSRPQDVHMMTGIEGRHRVIPFCATTCNNTNLTAVADEEGRVRLLDSAKDGYPSFKDVFLSFRVHNNAIIDMIFSDDDSLLATASGDQTARVVDMVTQTTLSALGNHSASLKQVRFQPGSSNNSVLATSSRDGSVQIWDLRCKGEGNPAQLFQIPTQPAVRLPVWGRPVNSIVDAHKQTYFTRLSSSLPGNDLPAYGEAAGRAGDMSVTAMTFLPEGREHLLVTASEGDASVKLWDLRSLHNKHKTQVALSQTFQPESHNRWRHFGISSMNVNSSGSRLYTLCKDNTVYTYSTNHLILGHAPELSVEPSGRKLPPKETNVGLGPIYGYRHPQLHATSFYVKSAIRKAKDGKGEMLAVGSSDGCAILFPTDERYFPLQQQHTDIESEAKPPTRRPGLRSMGSNSGRVDDSIPISTNGTPLIRGHDREVGSLAWTSNGDLVTVGDDFIVRCWREGEDARDLRTGGEAEGRRWGCGWADVSEEYDEDEC